MTFSGQPVLIKLYSNRRLYRPGAGAYVTLDDIASMVEDDDDVVILEASTGEDITPAILQQSIRKRVPHG